MRWPRGGERRGEAGRGRGETPPRTWKKRRAEMKGARILLVDDEVDFVDIMLKRLNKREVQAFGAHSAEEAMGVLHEHLVDVVILDVKMPGTDGIDALRKIKAEHPLVEVIMLTGHATVESAIDGMKLGAFDYLMKPTDLDLLLQKVGEAYEKKLNHEEKILAARSMGIADRRGD
jgi:DNA-binding NtrC family response regulator